MTKNVSNSREGLFDLALSVKNVSYIVGMTPETYWNNHLTPEEKSGFTWDIVESAMKSIPEEMAMLARNAMIHKLLNKITKMATA